MKQYFTTDIHGKKVKWHSCQDTTEDQAEKMKHAAMLRGDTGVSGILKCPICKREAEFESHEAGY